MRIAVTAVLAIFWAQAAGELTRAQGRLPQQTAADDNRVQQPYLPQGGGFRPNYRSDYNEWQSGYRGTPFETELGTHVPLQEKYDYPVYAGEYPLGYSRSSWSRPSRGYSPPGSRGETPGYISHLRTTNTPPSWINREAVRPIDSDIRDAAGLQVPPSWTPAGQQLEQEMRPAASPTSFRQRVRSWLPW